MTFIKKQSKKGQRSSKELVYFSNFATQKPQFGHAHGENGPGLFCWIILGRYTILELFGHILFFKTQKNHLITMVKTGGNRQYQY